MSPPPLRHAIPRRGSTRLLVFGLVLALSSCASPDTTSAPASSVMLAQRPTPAEPADVPADVTAGGIAVTPTGVPVAVLATPGASTVVRSPCGNELEIDAVRAIPPVTVVLDAGHGGPRDTGAVGHNGLLEAALNLTVAHAAVDELEARGVSVAMTRTGDYAVPLAVRAAFADSSGAEVLVSIHHNSPASAPSEIPGTEVFVQSTSGDSSRLGGLLYESTTRALSQFDITWTRRYDAGVLRVQRPDGADAYGLIRRPQIPTALVELGYLANPAEAHLFESSAYVDAAAVAIADGVERYLQTDGAGKGHVAEPRVFTAGGSHAEDGCTDPPLQ